MTAALDARDRHLPNAHLDVYADTGHWPRIEHPDRLAASLRTFLGGLS